MDRKTTEMKPVENDPQTYALIGAGMAVHGELGPGFHEPVYQAAMSVEFSDRKIANVAQPEIEVFYKRVKLPVVYKPDFICFGEVVLELKALTQLSGTEEAQVLNYLKATKLKRALLMNFGKPSLEWKRFVL